MKTKISPLLLATLSLFSSCCNDLFSNEPSITNNSVSQENQTNKTLFFRSSQVLWSVDQYAGKIVALDPNTFLPLWSSSGVVYQASITTPSIIALNDKNNARNLFVSPNPAFDRRIEHTEILGRIYFRLSELRVADNTSPSRCSSKSDDYVDQIVAFDSNVQGKFLWKLNADEVKQILQIRSSSIPRFVGAPLKGRGDVLVIVLTLDLQTISLHIDSRSGALVRE